MEDFNLALKSYLKFDSSPYTVIDINIDKNWISFDCLIDTGFNGFILLPLFYQKYFTLSQFKGERTYIIGNGTNLNLSVYKGRWRTASNIFNTEVLFTTTETCLVGTQFLKQFQLHINFIKHTIKLFN